MLSVRARLLLCLRKCFPMQPSFSLCSSLLAQDPVWTGWFSLSAVVITEAFSFLQGDENFSKGCGRNMKRSDPFRQVAEVMGDRETVNEKNRREKSKYELATGLSFWKHYKFSWLFSWYGFCEGTNRKVAAVVNSKVKWKAVKENSGTWFPAINGKKQAGSLS